MTIYEAVKKYNYISIDFDGVLIEHFFNKSYARVSADEYTILRAIAYERNSALNWICETTSEWEGLRID